MVFCPLKYVVGNKYSFIIYLVKKNEDCTLKLYGKY